MARKKGSTNKRAHPARAERKLVRTMVEDALGGKSIPQKMLELAGEDKEKQLWVLKELMPYTYPKLASIDVNALVEGSEDAQRLTEQRAQLEKQFKELLELKREEREVPAIEVEHKANDE